MAIPTDATHEAFIHDLNVVRVDVRMSAIEPGLRTLVEKLSQDLHVARADLAAERAVRDEYLDELEEIRSLLGAGPGVTALEAVKQAQKEIGEARSEANRCFVVTKERDEARAELTGLQDVNVAVRSIVGIGNGESLIAAVGRVVDRLRTLESAIRTLGKVLP